MVDLASPVVPGSRPRVRHYYHLYAVSGRWPSILRRHLHALAQADVDWDLVVGIVGSGRNVLDVVRQLPEGTRVETWPDGFEQRTLNLIREDIQAGYEGPVLYAHSKGAGFPVSVSAVWRQCMTRIVRDAQDCLAQLDAGADTVGCHWMTKEQFPDSVEIPFYGGNFWWATSEHLRKLGPPVEDHRHWAEAWLGSVPPQNPVSLVSGWPGAACRNH